MSISFSKEGYALETGYSDLHHYTSDTGVYTHSEYYEFTVGAGCPGHSTRVAPPEEPEGHAAVWSEDTQSWTIMESHIGETVYRKSDKAEVIIIAPGPLPDDVTALKPDAPYSVWDNDSDKWVNDKTLQSQYLKDIAEQRMHTLTQIASKKGWTLGLISMPDDVKEYASKLVEYLNSDDIINAMLPNPPSNLIDN